MSYKKAAHLIPACLLEQIQEYVDGEFIYIPRKSGNKQDWGTKTSIRREYADRNRKIFEQYQAGSDTKVLSEEFYLSLKTIQRIIRQEKLDRDSSFFMKDS